MKPKYNNDLIKTTVIETNEVHYFTSSGRCGAWLGKSGAFIDRHVSVKDEFPTFMGLVKCEYVDGSDIQYKYINI